MSEKLTDLERLRIQANGYEPTLKLLRLYDEQAATLERVRFELAKVPATVGGEDWDWDSYDQEKCAHAVIALRAALAGQPEDYK